MPLYNVNHHILANTVRVIGSEGENLGILSKEVALQMAREKELDLIEINPKANPPVAQIADFTHFKYQKTKELRKQKIKAKASEVKGIRLSIRIGKHDLEIRKVQAEKFLNKGNKVKIEIILRGNERSKAHLANGVIAEFVAMILESTPIKYEQEIKQQENKVSATVTKT